MEASLVLGCNMKRESRSAVESGGGDESERNTEDASRESHPIPAGGLVHGEEGLPLGNNSCLVCLNELCSNLGSERKSSPAPESKVTLVVFCSLLKVGVPSKSSFQTLEAPLCLECAGQIDKIKELVAQIEELEVSIRATRALINDKVLSCDKDFEPNGDVLVEGESALSSDIVDAINSIRSSIKQTDMLTGPAVHKKVGRKPGRKAQRNSATAKGAESTGRGAESHVKSSFGRVVKRPQYLMTTQSGGESDEVSEEEKKYDPSQHQGQKVNIKTEVAVADAEPGEIRAGSMEKTETKADDNDSEVEFQISLSDANWSDYDLSDDGDDRKQSKNPTRRKRKLKQTKHGKLESTQVQLVGVNGENLGGGIVKGGKVIIDHGFHKKLNTFPKVAKTKKVSDDNDKDEMKLECEKCARTFTDETKLERHMSKMHEDKSDYCCKSCNKKFTKMKDLKHHRKTEHRLKQHKIDEDGNKTFECEFCKIAFKSNSDLRIHIRTHTGERPFKCELCHEGFVSKGRHEVHVEVSHPDVPPLKCEFCPRSFFRHHRLRDHLKSHTGERPYLCEICSKAFSQPAYLKYHQTKHKELNLAEFKCDECDKKFASPINLRYHKETQHQRKYRYHCDVCGHGASHMSHMKLHQRSHTGERPHTCPHCGKSFTRASQLKIHIRSHTGERPYVCKTCGKTFTNSSKLRRHEITHGTNKSKRSRGVKVGSLITGSKQQGGSSSKTVKSERLGNNEDNNGQSVLKVEQVQPPEEEEQDIQQQLITIEQPNGVTYQVIAANTNDIGNETYAEYIVLNGDFTIT